MRLELWRAQVANVDSFHAGSANGLHAEVGVFVTAAFLGWDADAAGGFEEDVGRGFLVNDIFAGDDGVEEIANAEVNEDLFDDVFHASGSDSHGELAMVLARDGNDFVDGLDLRQEREIGVFFFERNGQMIERDVLLCAEHFQNVARWNAAQRIKSVLRKMQSVFLRHAAPRKPMQRHGVSKRPVTIKNQPSNHSRTITKLPRTPQILREDESR
jgi:hypothetical protein